MEDISWISRIPIAHRGLHSKKNDIPENSILAFNKAVENDYAIELDVFLSRSNELLVFHDESLLRMCGYDKSIFDYSRRDHEKFYNLDQTYEKIPILSDVFDLIDNKVPIIIHIREKKVKKRIEIFNAIYEVLKKFSRQEKVAIQSFDPFILRLFAIKLPSIIRGQLSSNFEENTTIPSFTKYMLSNYRLNKFSKPHYIAHDIKIPDKLLRKFKSKHIPVLCWTIKTREEQKLANKKFDNIIFENFIP